MKTTNWRNEVASCLLGEGYRLAIESDIVDGQEMKMFFFDDRQGIDQINVKHNSIPIALLARHAFANGTVYFRCRSREFDLKYAELCQVSKIDMLGGLEVSRPLCILFIVQIC